mgnify:CR=1 FL=1
MNILDFIFPKFCYGCHKIGNYICKKCLKKITTLKTQKCPNCLQTSFEGKFCKLGCGSLYSFDQLIVCSNYQENLLLKKLIHQFKFRFNKDLAVIIAEIIKLELNKFNLRNYIIIPVPLHKKDLIERGYNQTKLICKQIDKENTLDCLRKIRITRKQSQLNKKERLMNLNGAFDFNKKFKYSLLNKKVILLDDVSTTLTTLNECSKILKKNGVSYIIGVVLARA